MSDLINRSIRPVVSVTTTFTDLRRVIRAIRFKHQHDMTLSYEVKQFITTNAPFRFQNHRKKYEFIGDYVKVLSDKNNCSIIFCELAAGGLVINSERVTIDVNRLNQAIAAIDDDKTSGININRLLTSIKHLGRAIAVTCSLMYTRASSLTIGDISSATFFNIIRNLLNKPRHYEGKSESYIHDIQYLISTEITSKNPKLLKLLQVYNIDPSQPLHSQTRDLSSLYAKLLPPQSDSDTLSTASMSTAVSRDTRATGRLAAGVGHGRPFESKIAAIPFAGTSMPMTYAANGTAGMLQRMKDRYQASGVKTSAGVPVKSALKQTPKTTPFDD